jgi:hypothetical protein
VALAAAELLTSSKTRAAGNQAIATLFDPHAGSNEKLAAIHILEKAESRQGHRLIFPLVRQCES